MDSIPDEPREPRRLRFPPLEELHFDQSGERGRWVEDFYATILREATGLKCLRILELSDLDVVAVVVASLTMHPPSIEMLRFKSTKFHPSFEDIVKACLRTLQLSELRGSTLHHVNQSSKHSCP